MHPITESTLLIALSGAIVDRLRRPKAPGLMTRCETQWNGLIAFAAFLWSCATIMRWLFSFLP